MPLLSLLAASPEALRQLSIEQIVATAGDGRLRDGTESQTELREYLKRVSIEALSGYADYCLSNAFSKSGHVLQDIVNELGRRLEYEVTNGRYQGTVNAVGFDGIWRDPTGHSLIVEVKTTDAYRLSLDTLAGYRDQLKGRGDLTEPCSLLIIVGRTDTGELEAQVRGSRHAWDIRLISIDALLNLVRIKESAEGQDTIAKIRRLLVPLEYTRLDQLVDVMFTTTQDVETAVSADSTKPVESEEREDNGSSSGGWEFTPPVLIQSIRDKILLALGRRLELSFVKKSRALYWDPTHSSRVACTVSKRYSDQGAARYWYAYHPAWHIFLEEAERGLFVLGCVDLDVAFALPINVIAVNLEKLNTTETKNGTGHYYHVKIVEPGPGSYGLQLPRTGETLPLEAYSLVLS
jgi:hypothetical protein